jgi:hypothetical protein
MSLLKWVVISLAFVFWNGQSTASAQQVYKCVDPKTKQTNFTDKPCNASETKTTINTTPNVVTPFQKKNEKQSADRFSQQLKSESVVEKRPALDDLIAECKQARHQLDLARRFPRAYGPETVADIRLKIDIACQPASGGSSGSSCFGTHLNPSKEFLGNHGEIFKTMDGKIWEVNDYRYNYLYRYGDSVDICRRGTLMIINKKEIGITQVR